MVSSTCRFNGLTGVVTRVVLVVKINPTQHGLASRVSKETTQDSGGKIANCVYCIQLSSEQEQLSDDAAMTVPSYTDWSPV